MTSNLESLRARLNKLRTQPAPHDDQSGQLNQNDVPEAKKDLTTEITGQPCEQGTGFSTWLANIESQGNHPDDWLHFTCCIRDEMNFTDEQTRTSCLNNYYAMAISSVPTRLQKNESFAHLLVNCGLFRGHDSVDYARNLLSNARRSGKRYAFVHVAAAQFELDQGYPENCKRILEKGKDVDAQPIDLLKVAFRNLLDGRSILVSEEDRRNLQSTAQIDSQVSCDGYVPLEVRPSWGSKRTAGILNDQPSDFDHTGGNNYQSHTSGGHEMNLLLPKKSWLNGSNSSDDSISIDQAKAKHLVYRSGKPGVFSPGTPGGAYKPWEISLSATLSSTVAPESTISFAQQGQPHRERNASGNHSDDNDTIPTMFDNKKGVYTRTLRNCDSTPNCKNINIPSAISSGRKRFTGKPMRTLKSALPQLNEKEDSDSDGDHPWLPPPGIKSPLTYTGTNYSDAVHNRSSSSQDGDSGIQNTQGIYYPGLMHEVESIKATAVTKPNDTQQETMDVDDFVPMTGSNLDVSNVLQPKMSTSSNTSINQSQSSITLKGNVSQQNCHMSSQGHSQGFAPSSFNQELSSGFNHSQGHKSFTGHMHSGRMGATPQPANSENRNYSHSGQLMNIGSGQLPYPMPVPMQTPVKQHEILTVNGKVYNILRLMGKGGTSKVYEVLDVDKNLRAVKCVNLEHADETTITCCRNEISLLQRLQYSDKVIKMYDHDYDDSTGILYVVMERGERDLATYFANQKKMGKIDELTRMFYWKQMLEAVQVLHKEGIVHSDLKPANFLLVAGNLKLIDFGIANEIQGDLTSVTRDQQVGTLNYMSPEAISDTCGGQQVDEHGRVKPRIKIGTKSDVWSLGCIMYNMVYLRTPFQSVTNQICKLQAIMNPNFPIEFPDIPEKNLKDVLKKCLVRDPKQRPTIDELLCHPYLRNISQPQKETPKAEKHGMNMITQEYLAMLVKQLAPVSSPGTVSTLSQGLLNQLQSGKAPDVSSLKRRPVTGNPPPVPVELKPGYNSSLDGTKSKISEPGKKHQVKHIPRAPLHPLNIPQAQKPT